MSENELRWVCKGFVDNPYEKNSITYDLYLIIKGDPNAEKMGTLKRTKGEGWQWTSADREYPTDSLKDLRQEHSAYFSNEEVFDEWERENE